MTEAPDSSQSWRHAANALRMIDPASAPDAHAATIQAMRLMLTDLPPGRAALRHALNSAAPEVLDMLIAAHGPALYAGLQARSETAIAFDRLHDRSHDACRAVLARHGIPDAPAKDEVV